MSKAMVGVGLVGAGSWGRNYIRVLNQLGVLTAVCETDQQSLNRLKSDLPDVLVTADLPELLAAESVGAVVVAAPTEHHYPIARQALELGRHCLVEKPLAESPEQASLLCRLAARNGLVLMPGHILIFHPVIRKLKTLVDDGHFGNIYYIAAARCNIGTIRRHENVMWSLAPHDISAARYLIGGEPLQVSATAGSYVQPQDGIFDISNLNLMFRDGISASIVSSWLDPEKVRTLKLVGSERMALFNDMEPRYKLEIHDKGVDWQQFEVPSDAAFLKVRSGSVNLPFVEPAEPLAEQCGEFLSAIAEKRKPATPGEDGHAVVSILAAAEASIALGGTPVETGL